MVTHAVFTDQNGAYINPSEVYFDVEGNLPDWDEVDKAVKETLSEHPEFAKKYNKINKNFDGHWIRRDINDVNKYISPVLKGDVIKMSKSKKNVVDPDEIIEGYGADGPNLA